MKNLLTVLLMLVLTNISWSQDQKKIQLGLVGSSDLSWFQSDRAEVVNDGVKLNLRGGINLDYQLLDNYYLNTGIIFNNFNAALQYTSPNTPFMANDQIRYFNTDSAANPVTVDYKLSYLEIPVGMKLKTNEIGYFTYHAVFGLKALFNTKALADANQLSLVDANINDEVQFFNLGGYFGLGADYIITRKLILSATMRYNPGFLDVTSNDAGRPKDKIILNSLGLQVGISF